MRHRFTLALICLIGLMSMALGSLQAQTSFTFSTGGATGNTGPTQPMLDAAYLGTTLDGDVWTVGGIQYWIVPVTGIYLIETSGGQGYGNFGGRGAFISGEFPLQAGDTLKIIVGQQAGPYLNFPATTYNHQFGGGGGSFVALVDNTPLIVAGGGGGNHGNSFIASCDGQIGVNGAPGVNASTTGAGGTGGNGGQQATSADGGGGFFGNGGGTAGGQSFVNGGVGGIDEGTGGFGCGGGTSSWNNYRGGGGGGYSGGGGSNNGGSCCPAAGGGGSFNAGTSPIALAGFQLGDGTVKITSLSKLPNDGGIEEITGFAPPVCKGTYPVIVDFKNFGNNEITSATIQWSVNGISQPDYVWTGSLDTANGAGPDSALLNIGNVTINSGTTIKVWTSIPNGLVDTSNFNDTADIAIAAPVVISTMVDSNVSCFGFADGGASSMTSGGVGPYSYSWNTGDTTTWITGQFTGTYSVTVTDNVACTDTSSIFIFEPTALGSIETTQNISCNGRTDGEAIVNPTGGTSGYTVNWFNGSISVTQDALSAGWHGYSITDANGCNYVDSVQIIEPAPINWFITDVTSHVSCNGGNDGSTFIMPSGGNPGYRVVWVGGDTSAYSANLSAGTYNYQVIDVNGCSHFDSVVINEPAPINWTVNDVTTDISCNGNNDGTSLVTPSGGQPGYTVVWTATGDTTNYIENLAGGFHTYWVWDANGCSYNDSVFVTDPAPINWMVSDVTTDISCNGSNDGTSLVSPSGGMPGYVVVWDASGDTSSYIDNLAAGYHSYSVWDANGCWYNDSVWVFEPAPINWSVSDQTQDVTCYGANDGSSVVTPMGGTPGYIVVWENGDTSSSISNLGAGYTSYMVYDANGCGYEDSVQVIEPSAIALSATSMPDTNSGYTGMIDATVSGGTSPYKYLWNNGAGTEDQSGLASGNYMLTVTDAKGCEDTVSVTVNAVMTGINDLQPLLGCSIFPNPSKGQLTVKVDEPGEDISIEVFDMVGKQVQVIEHADLVTSLELLGTDGIYIIRVSNGERSYTQRVVVQR